MLTDEGGVFRKIFGFIGANQHPSGFFPRQYTSHHEFRNILLAPIKGAEGHHVAEAVSECLQGRFNMRELFEGQVALLAVSADGFFDLATGAVLL